MTALFGIGSKVVHPCYGAGTIVRIQEKTIGETNNAYYIIRPISRDMQLMVPVDRAHEVNLRPVGDLTRLRQALREPCDLAQEAPPLDLRQRQSAMRARLKSGSFGEVVRVTRLLYAMSTKRPLGSVDRELLEQGKAFLASELALAAEVEMAEALQEVEAMLQQALEPPQEEDTPSQA